MDILLQTKPSENQNFSTDFWQDSEAGRERGFGSLFQNALVPEICYQDAHIEIYGQTVAKEEVGGDLVDFVADGGEIVAYVADASGHGLPAAMLMGMVKTAVRYGLELNQDLPALLGSLNQVLPAVKESNMYATFAGLRFHPSKEAEYTTAGNVPLLHYRRRQGEIIRYSIAQFPLGLFEDAEYVSARVGYEAGDVFLLVTDGVVEAADGQGNQFGFEPLEQILTEMAGCPLPLIFEAALEAVTRHGRQQDDQTLLLVRAR